MTKTCDGGIFQSQLSMSLMSKKNTPFKCMANFEKDTPKPKQKTVGGDFIKVVKDTLNLLGTQEIFLNTLNFPTTFNNKG